MDLLDLALGFLIGLGATFFFVASGGVGLVTLPSLIALGLSPQAAIGTDLFAMLGGRLGGLIGLRRAGKVDLALGGRLALAAGLGAVGGAFTLLAIPESLMRRLLGLLLLVILAVILLRPRAGIESGGEVSRTRHVIGTLLFVMIGFEATLVGAGFLPLMGMVLILVLRRTFLETAGVLTLVGLAVGGVALVIFGAHGVIEWPLGIAMLVGKSIGGYLGAGFAVRWGEARIRALFVCVVLVASIQLLVR